jgi:hypothetical protein
MIEEDARRLTERLRLSNVEAARLEAMASRRPLLKRDSDLLSLKTALYRLGAPRYPDRVLIAWTRDGAACDDAVWREHLRLPERWLPPVFPLRGEDLLATGIERGPRIGACLKELELAWIASDFALTRKDLLEAARRLT